MAPPAAQPRQSIAEAMQRLDVAERDLRDHSKTLTEITTVLGRVTDWKASQELMMAREDERDKSLYRRLEQIEKSVDEVRDEARASVKEIRSAGSKLQWMVIGAVVVGIVTFIFKGGFAI